MVRVLIDAAKCHGHARCSLILPAVFDTDELGNGVVVHEGEVPEVLEGRARQAILNCPEHAITEVDPS